MPLPLGTASIEIELIARIAVGLNRELRRIVFLTIDWVYIFERQVSSSQCCMLISLNRSLCAYTMTICFLVQFEKCSSPWMFTRLRMQRTDLRWNRMWTLNVWDSPLLTVHWSLSLTMIHIIQLHGLPFNYGVTVWLRMD